MASGCVSASRPRQARAHPPHVADDGRLPLGRHLLIHADQSPPCVRRRIVEQWSLVRRSLRPSSPTPSSARRPDSAARWPRPSTRRLRRRPCLSGSGPSGSVASFVGGGGVGLVVGQLGFVQLRRATRSAPRSAGGRGTAAGRTRPARRRSRRLPAMMRRARACDAST